MPDPSPEPGRDPAAAVVADAPAAVAADPQESPASGASAPGCVEETPADPASSDLERRLDSLLDSMTRPGRMTGEAASEPDPNDDASLASVLAAPPGSAPSGSSPPTDRSDGAEPGSSASGGRSENEQAGELFDLDALLAAEADSAFGDTDALRRPEPETGSDRPSTPAATPVREADRDPTADGDFLDLGTLEREVAGLPPEVAPPEPRPAENPSNAPGTQASPRPPEENEAPAAGPGDINGSEPSAGPEQSAGPAAGDADAQPRNAGPSGWKVLLNKLTRLLTALVDRPLQAVARPLPAAVGSTVQARADTLRLWLGLAGVCLAGPGLVMLMLGLLTGG